MLKNVQSGRRATKAHAGKHHPDSAEFTLDIRALPGTGEDHARTTLASALRELRDGLDLVFVDAQQGSASPAAIPLMESLNRAVTVFQPGYVAAPFMLPGTTDPRFFRPLGERGRDGHRSLEC